MLLKRLDLDKISDLLYVLRKLDITDKMTITTKIVSEDIIDVRNIVSLTDEAWFLHEYFE